MANEEKAKTPANHNLQDLFLNEMRKSGATVQIYLTNGYQVRGKVKGFDNFTVVVEGRGKEKEEGIREQLVYKHAISTITPMKNIDAVVKNDDVAAPMGNIS